MVLTETDPFQIYVYHTKNLFIWEEGQDVCQDPHL